MQGYSLYIQSSNRSPYDLYYRGGGLPYSPSYYNYTSPNPYFLQNQQNRNYNPAFHSRLQFAPNKGPQRANRYNERWKHQQQGGATEDQEDDRRKRSDGRIGLRTPQGKEDDGGWRRSRRDTARRRNSRSSRSKSPESDTDKATFKFLQPLSPPHTRKGKTRSPSREKEARKGKESSSSDEDDEESVRERQLRINLMSQGLPPPTKAELREERLRRAQARARARFPAHSPKQNVAHIPPPKKQKRALKRHTTPTSLPSGKKPKLKPKKVPKDGNEEQDAEDEEVEVEEENEEADQDDDSEDSEKEQQEEVEAEKKNKKTSSSRSSSRQSSRKRKSSSASVEKKEKVAKRKSTSAEKKEKEGRKAKEGKGEGEGESEKEKKRKKKVKKKKVSDRIVRPGQPRHKKRRSTSRERDSTDESEAKSVQPPKKKRSKYRHRKKTNTPYKPRVPLDLTHEDELEEEQLSQSQQLLRRRVPYDFQIVDITVEDAPTNRESQHSANQADESEADKEEDDDDRGVGSGGGGGGTKTLSKSGGSLSPILEETRATNLTITTNTPTTIRRSPRSPKTKSTSSPDLRNEEKGEEDKPMASAERVSPTTSRKDRTHMVKESEKKEVDDEVEEVEKDEQGGEEGREEGAESKEEKKGKDDENEEEGEKEEEKEKSLFDRIQEDVQGFHREFAYKMKRQHQYDVVANRKKMRQRIREIDKAPNVPFCAFARGPIEGQKKSKKVNLEQSNEPVESIPGYVGTTVYEEPIPTASTYITINKNVVKEDDKLLHFVPYFGENDKTSIDFSVYSDDSEESEVEDPQDDDALLRILAKHGAGEEVWQNLSSVLCFSVEMLKKRFRELTAIPKKKQESMDLLMDSYEKLFCRRCYFYDCKQHGMCQPRPRGTSDRKIPVDSEILADMKSKRQKLLEEQQNGIPLPSFPILSSLQLLSSTDPLLQPNPANPSGTAAAAAAGSTNGLFILNSTTKPPSDPGGGTNTKSTGGTDSKKDRSSEDTSETPSEKKKGEKTTTTKNKKKLTKEKQGKRVAKRRKKTRLCSKPRKGGRHVKKSDSEEEEAEVEDGDEEEGGGGGEKTDIGEEEDEEGGGEKKSSEVGEAKEEKKSLELESSLVVGGGSSFSPPSSFISSSPIVLLIERAHFPFPVTLPESSCTELCFLNLGPQALPENPIDVMSLSEENLIDDIDSKWTSMERVLFRKLWFSAGANFCLIARILGSKSCQEIFLFASKFGPTLPVHASIDKRTNKVKVVSPDPKKKRKKRKGRHLLALRLKASRKRNLPHAYTPCDHDGDCLSEGSECVCARNLSFCEKYCACSAKCKNRFTGCQCKGCRCQTRACPCFAAHRECDLDLCNLCVGSVTDEKDGKDERVCHNISIQLHDRQPLLLGPSTIHGWGAFCKYGTKKNELVTEYLGELISQDEADRRGKIYDKVNKSYLFNLNEEYVVDAARKGNKIKFANHSENPNCFSRVMLVNGNHRIGIYAKRKIKEREELFFDYKHEHAGTAPEWFIEKKSSNTGPVSKS